MTVELGYAALARGELTPARARFAAGLDEAAALLTGCIESTYTELAAHVIPPDALIAARFLEGARARPGGQQWSETARQGAALGIDEAAAVALARVG